MTFKEWLTLNEVGTGTNSIATFARPVFGGPVRRPVLPGWGEEADDGKRGKNKKKG